MKKILTVALISITLTGCKVDFTTEVNTDDLISKEMKVVNGGLNFEVTSCNDFEDSRKESKSLIKIKRKVSDMFNNTEYKGCYRQQLNSFASFTVPVSVGEIKDDALNISTDFLIYSNEKTLLSIALTDAAKNKFKNAEKEFRSMLNFTISVDVTKGEKDYPDGHLLSSYVTAGETKKKPISVGDISAETLKKFKITLSNVATDILLEDGSYPIILRKDN